MPPYTVIGGSSRAGSTGLSAIILMREGRYPRQALLEELQKAGFDYVLSMEGDRRSYDIEELSHDFPFAEFISFKRRLDYGAQINMAARELQGPLFFVLWNDMKFLRGARADRMAERLLSRDKPGAIRLCTTPMLQDSHFETMPTISAPALDDNKIKTVPLLPEWHGQPCLFPYDGIGIYDRERFIRMGGFDTGIHNFHWQLLDFGFRAWLWGEETALTQNVKLSFLGNLRSEDVTHDAGYLRFYLKCIAPVFRGDYAHIPLRRFPRFAQLRRESLGGGLLESWHDFHEGRRWVKANASHFCTDARLLADTWKTENTRAQEQAKVAQENDQEDNIEPAKT
jgi:hypothetical protein